MLELGLDFHFTVWVSVLQSKFSGLKLGLRLGLGSGLGLELGFGLGLELGFGLGLNMMLKH